VLEIFVDADACPVKQEVYKVARRYDLRVWVVSASHMRTPADEPKVQSVAAGSGFNAADDWIAERIGQDDVCITADIPLAARCIGSGAHALGPRGKRFTEDSIGETVATRDLLDTLRGAGMVSGGPPPITGKDRSKFLNVFDQIVQEVLRKRG